MLKIGLAGGIASGKSEVARHLERLGARVVDADRVAHTVYEPGRPGFGQLVDAFGAEIIGDDGRVDRRRLGAAVFGKRAQLDRLTAIVWPLARAEVEGVIRQAVSDGVEVFVLEAPLLIEAGWRDLVDEVWFVRAATDTVRRRLAGRGLNERETEARLASREELPLAERAATLIIDNDGEIAELQAKVEASLRQLLNQAG